MMQNIFDKVCHALSDGKVNLMELSRRSGVAYGTLHSLSQRKGNPTIATLIAVEKALYEDHSDPNLTCENCDFCMDYDEANNHYGCEVAMSAKRDKFACWLYRETKTDAT